MTDMPPSPEPLPGPTPPSDRSWAAIVSLICGILSIVPGFCCCLVSMPMGVAGIVFGVLGLKSRQDMLAKIGMGLSILGFIIFIVMMVLQLLFHIAVPGARNHF